MKWFKLLGMVVATVALVAVGLTAWATPTASANGGPHGNFTLTTSGCGGCHRAHTAVSPYLLKADNEFDLCTSCHSGLVSTDVVHGQWGSTGAPMNGGGFEQAVIMSDYLASGTPVVGPVTSSHTVADLPVNGTPASGIGTAWGGKSSGVGAGPGELECTNCHNPHGSTNYRILRDDNYDAAAKWLPNSPDLLQWVKYQVLATETENPPVYGLSFNSTDCPASLPAVIGGTPRAINTAVSSVLGTPVAPAGIYIRCKARYTSGVFAYVTQTVITGKDVVPNPLKGMNAFCATCHKSYLTMTGSAQNVNSLNVPKPELTTSPTAWARYLTAVANWPPGTPIPPAVGAGTPVPTAVAAWGYPYLYPGTQDALDGQDIARYRHAVDRTHTGGKQPLRFAALGNDPSGGSTGPAYAAFGCLTCHFAHGSAAAATPASLTGLVVPTVTPGGPTVTPVPADGPTGDSSLLFYSNRGVCITCHQTLGAVPTPTAY